jgi:hypothetical protein
MRRVKLYFSFLFRVDRSASYLILLGWIKGVRCRGIIIQREEEEEEEEEEARLM